ncbi:F-actin-capping protein subunit alpha [Agyrium rufum]|nr:F-actin-capping protein subunit alpha [Agyrium rufum]
MSKGSNAAAVSAFIDGAPPGELADVIADIKSLTLSEPDLLKSATPAFQKYNEEQLTTTKLPGASQNVIISRYNSLGDGRYYDTESRTSFAFDHATQKASASQSYVPESDHNSIINSLLTSLKTYASEHFPSSTTAVFPVSSSSEIAILLVANKYSPSNFWNGRFRSTYLFTPSSSSLTGTINVDVHYYEDGNVRLTTSKKVDVKLGSGGSGTGSAGAQEVIKQIAGVERKYQEELNRGFNSLSEGAFKGLRRQLPITRQKVEWEKVGGYRLGQDIGGGRAR